MENSLTLKIYLDNREVSRVLLAYVEEMARLTDKIKVEVADDLSDDEKTCVKVFRGGETEVYDIDHSTALKGKFNVMSVPCLVVSEKVIFGKKNIAQLLDFIS